MAPAKLLHRLLAAAALNGAIALIAACGSESAPPPKPSPTPAVAKDVTCGPSSSKIASVPRTGQHAFKALPATIIDASKSYTALIKTDKGDITVDLLPKAAPVAVNNFVFLACDGFYDGLIFHRVVKDPSPFVIQGGDPRGDGTGGPGYIFDDEYSPDIRFDAPGVLAMANAGPGTNGSQFYITLVGQPALNDKYSAFGKVTSGQDVANKIAQGDKIISIAITEK
jgi:peptidyl-prolyl cis-trans isomerase B (cyclophilin B)